MKQKSLSDQRRDSFSKKEAERRFMAALKAAMNTPPKPLKNMKSKQPKKQGSQKAKG